jgi:hypothetical protein
MDVATEAPFVPLEGQVFGDAKASVVVQLNIDAPKVSSVSPVRLSKASRAMLLPEKIASRG